MIFTIGASIAFFLAFLLCTKKSNTPADKVLAAWMAVTGLHLMLFYLNIVTQHYDYPFLLGLEIPLPLVHGAFLFYYVSHLTRQTTWSSRFWCIHILPALLAYAAIIPFMMAPSSYKIYVFQHEGIGYEGLIMSIYVAMLLLNTSYILASLHLLKKHRKRVREAFSTTERINLHWLQYLIYGLSAIYATTLLGNDYWIHGMTVAFVLLTGYLGVHQVGIFLQTEPDPAVIASSADHIMDLNDAAQDKKKYAKSGLNEEAAAQMQQDLSRLMEREKRFTEAELTLADLAKLLSVHPNYLSQVINEKEGMNFYDYVNTQRVEAFKTLLDDPANQKYTLLGLAYQCGFNSKSAFNRQFKKVTGYSPSEYLQRLKKDSPTFQDAAMGTI